MVICFITMLTFDAEKALTYAKDLSRPRLVGSPGETEAREYIVNKLAGFGLKVQEEPFEFSYGLEANFKKCLLIFFMLLITSFLCYWKSPLLSIFTTLILLILLFSYRQWGQRILVNSWQTKGKRTGRLHKFFYRQPRTGLSRNIIAQIGAEGQEHLGVRQLYLMAHYDSKSQNLPLAMRILSVLLFVVGSFVFALCVILVGLRIVPRLTEINQWLLPLVFTSTLASGMSLLVLKSGNCSAGAIDNAAGVGILLHLAEIITQLKNNLTNLRLTFLTTAAEELGLIGALAYCKAHQEELIRQKDTAYFINLDGPGVNGSIYAVFPEKWCPGIRTNSRDALEMAGKELGLKIKKPPIVIGALADHIPFAMLGLDVVSLSTVALNSLVVHTVKDTPDKLEREGLDKMGRLICKFIEKLL